MKYFAFVIVVFVGGYFFPVSAHAQDMPISSPEESGFIPFDPANGVHEDMNTDSDADADSANSAWLRSQRIESQQEEESNTAFDFIDTVAKAAKKRAKPWLGYSPITPLFGNPLRTLQNQLFDARTGGARWTITADEAGQPIARGRLTGKITNDAPSNMFIDIALHTGCTRIQFNSLKSNWVADYCNEGGSERAELFDMKGELYQKENIFDAEGGELKVELVAHQGTVFGSFAGGFLFITSPGIFPAVNPRDAETIAVPHGQGDQPLVPVEKIIRAAQEIVGVLRNAFFAVSYAATSGTLSAREAIAELPRYQKEKQKLYDMHYALYTLLQKTDWHNMSQREYEDLQNKTAVFKKQQGLVAAGAKKLGPLLVFVRDGGWRDSDTPLVDYLARRGVAGELGLLLAQASAPFDFYAISDTGGAKRVMIKGSCSVSSCSVKSVLPEEVRDLTARVGQYAAVAAAADAKNNAIQKALFFGAGK